jgi:hypothetical protein
MILDIAEIDSGEYLRIRGERTLRECLPVSRVHLRYRISAGKAAIRLNAEEVLFGALGCGKGGCGISGCDVTLNGHWRCIRC